MALEIEQIPVLTDNYIYLLHEPAAGITAVVDPAESGPVLDRLKARGWRLDFILNTHHHGDHVGGNLSLKQTTGCRVVGPRADAARIPGIDEALGEGDEFALGQAQARVFDVPGHTRGHIAYWFESEHALFCGDTLFALGCGRLFEGTPGQMWQSLSKLRRLPGETRVYCAHEYTQANARFALSVEGESPALRQRAALIDRLRAEGRPTVPSTIADEIATNPFLRADQESLRKGLGPAFAAADPTTIFGETRRRKDGFRG